MRQLAAAVTWLLAAAIPVLDGQSLADELDIRRQRLQAMSAEEKEALLRKKERFERLSPAEQQRMRQLHADIAGHENSQRLKAMLARYNEWLKTLPTAERTKLLGLPADERINQIRQIQQQQARRTFGLSGDRQEPPGDLDKLLAWAIEYVRNHEAEIVASMPPQVRQQLLRADRNRRQRMLLFAAIGVTGRRRPTQRMPMPTQQELEQLKEALSPQARRIMESEPNAARRTAQLQRWLQLAVLSKLLPPVNDEQLRSFENSLSDEEREKLDQLPPDQRWRQLRRMYYMRNRPS